MDTEQTIAPSSILEEVDFDTIRRKGVGGSDVAAILGVSRFRTPHDVFLDKMGLSVREENEALYWGKVLEPFVLTEYEKRLGIRVERLEFPKGFRRHPRRNWMLGNLDALAVGRPIGIDAKTTAGWRELEEWGQPGTDEIPNEYILQMQWYLAIMENLERFDVAVLIGGRDFRVYHIMPNRDLQAFLVETCGEWWEKYVLTKMPPPPDETEGAKRMLERLYPRDQGVIRAATTEEAALLDSYRQAQKALDTVFENRDRLRNLICAAIGEDVGLNFDGGKVTWKRTKDGTEVKWEAVARELAAHASIRSIEGMGSSGTPIPLFDLLVRKHTAVKPGVRRFLPKFDERSEKNGGAGTDG